MKSGFIWALAVFVMAFFTVLPATAQLNAADSSVSLSDPYAMVNTVAMKTFNRMKAEEQDIINDPEMLRLVMKEELLPYIDYRFSAFKVLGKYASKMEQDKLVEFVSVFREYLITSYALAMGYYDNQEVQFEPATDFNDRSTVTVRAVIIDDVRPDIKVAFKVRKNRSTGEWRAYDMVAEGISLLQSKRSEFESIIRRDGIDAVLQLMREKIEQPIELNRQMPESSAGK